MIGSYTLEKGTENHRYFPGLIAISLLLITINHNIASQTVNHWESLVLAGDNWHYFPGASEPPAIWNEPDFDDSSWSEGPGGIGYGDNDDATIISPVISLYMRARFNVIDVGAIEMAALHVDSDDGFVAYINGYEIARFNIGTVGTRPLYNGLASSNYEAKLPSGGIPSRFLINKDTLLKYLVQGENILALQVHNSTVTSSDMSSTTYLSVGINDDTHNYREVPSWFNDPLAEYTNLPLVVIETRGQTIKDDPKITAWMKVIDNGSGKTNNPYQDGTDYEGYIGIEIHGQSSQMFPKKSYAIETRDETGANLSTGLLGMPADEDWVLYAPYSDKTLLRNALTYYLGSRMGSWQPRFRFCEVYLNGDYIGIYMLVEKIKRGKDRVDINKLKPEETSGDDLTGGYIIKNDKLGGLTNNEYFTTHPTVPYLSSTDYSFTYVYPKPDEIVYQQREYIFKYMTDLENTLNGNSFKDIKNGFRKYLDTYSFVDFQIIEELTKNVDGYRFSNYFYKKKDSDGGKLFAGPIWDFDLGYGNEDYHDFHRQTNGWLYSEIGPSAANRMHWWKRLMEDAGYRTVFKNRWRELRKGAFNTDSVMMYMDNTIQLLGESVDRNFEKWEITGKYVWPNYYIGNTYEEDVDYLKGWITDRMQWIDENIANTATSGDVSSKQDILVYPNPVKDQMNLVIYLSYANEIKVRFELFDLLGRSVFNELVIPGNEGYQEFSFNVSKLMPGYYILKVMQGEKLIGTKNILINNM
ncbi:MAG: CotH kinase family protein [Bacteroidales bacterium]|nr:CotH kinase family protein [Bacteroidales bacterium]